METSERTYVLDGLEVSRSKLLASVEGLTAEQWDYLPGDGRWSIANCVEHVVLVENRILKAIGKVLERAPEPGKRAEVARKELLLKDGTLLDRTQKLSAPEPVAPKRQWPDIAQLLAEFRSTRARTVEYVSSTEGNLRDHFFPHIAFGDLDCYQWLMLLPVHCERHVAQIEEIKSDAGFPRAKATPA